MIPKRAVRSFLGRQRDDLRRYKAMSDAALAREALALPARPPVWKRLQRDQRVLLVVGAKYRRVAFWADTGIGKTLASMALARYFRREGSAARFLVLVPNKINLAEWEDEQRKHCPRTSLIALRGSSTEKWAQLRAGAPLLTVATYGGLVRMVTAPHIRRRVGGKLRWVPVARAQLRRGEQAVMRFVPSRVRELAQTFSGLIMDESSADQAVQYRTSLAFRVCRQIAKSARVVFALSGTPFGRDPTPLWAQMYLVDSGESLGPTLGLFRAAFFSTTENPWGGEEHVFRERMSPTLHRLLAHRSVTIEADEASLPPVVEQVREVQLPHEAEEYCVMAREAITAARGNYQETKNAFLRMRQISSGFLGYSDDETGARAKFEFDSNPKLESLISFVQSVGGRHKIVVFHEYIYSGDRIAEELTRLKIGWARVGAGAKAEAKDEVGRFKTAPGCAVLIISNRMAMGPNLQVAKYVAFYEAPVSPKTRKQARRRVERQHSEHDRVFLVDFVARGTYDQKILDFHAEGRDLFDAIIRGRERA